MRIKTVVCLRELVCSAILLALCSWCVAQTRPAPALGKVWSETLLGDPQRAGGETGRGLKVMPESAYTFENGMYKSVVSRIKLKLPQLDSETHVSVREAVVSRRPDGTVITSHIVFVPDALGMASPPERGVSAIVVTRLRDDRPKDRESVLKTWEPPTEEQRLNYEKAGIFHSRIRTPQGEHVLQRVILNRAFIEPFPYQTRVAQGNAQSVGISRFVVIEGDSLIEFSQIVPCGSMEALQCRQVATDVADRFVDGVAEFLIFPQDTAKVIDGKQHIQVDGSSKSR